MRLVTYGAACSLDGFITGPDGAIDWIQMTPDAGEVMRAYWETVDTILMGRKTWEFAAGMGGGGGGGFGGGGISTYVFSRTLDALDRKGMTLVREDAGAFVRALKSQPGRGICLMGGGVLARALFDAGVVDEVGLNIHPVLLGGGVPMFATPGAPGARVQLELSECRAMQGGCAYVTYRVREPQPRGATRRRTRTTAARTAAGS